MRPEIDITLKQPEGVSITLATIPEGVNVSNADKIIDPTNYNRTVGFQLSGDVGNICSLGGKYTFFGTSGFDGLLTKNYTWSRPVTLSVEVIGMSALDLWITFDPATGEHPRIIICRSDDKTIFTISDNTSVLVHLYAPDQQLTSNTITIVLAAWRDVNDNPVNHSYKVTGLLPAPHLVFSGSSIGKFNCSENQMDSNLSLTPGICEQYADVSIYDRDGILHHLATYGYLNEDSALKIRAYDTEERLYALGAYLVANWDVQNDDDYVDIDCHDRSYAFEKILLAQADVDSRTLDELLGLLFEKANSPWKYLDAETQSRCENILMPQSYWVSKNLETLLTEACALGMLRIYWYVDTFFVGRCE